MAAFFERIIHMNKIDIIKELEKQDSSVLSFANRGPWGNNKYRGNCSGWIQAFLIWKYQVSKFAELFSGSGTGYDVCRDMEVSYVGADLNPEPARPGILAVNAITDDVPVEFFDADMIFMHPPYGAEIGIPYAGAEWGAEKRWQKINGHNKLTYMDKTAQLIKNLGYDPKQYDLGRMEWPQFIVVLNKIVMKYFVSMMNGGKMAILMGDVRRNGKYYSMLSDIVKPGHLEQIIIKMQHNTMSGLSNNQYKGNFVPIAHEYIMIIKKMEPYFIDFQIPVKKKLDIRDSKDTTWKEVVWAALQNLGGTATLTDLYAEIEGYSKCRQNPNWKASVRKALQFIPNCYSVSKGKWASAS